MIYFYHSSCECNCTRVAHHSWALWVSQETLQARTLPWSRWMWMFTNPTLFVQPLHSFASLSSGLGVEFEGGGESVAGLKVPGAEGIQLPTGMASALATAYLTCYNAAQSIGWAVALVRLTNHVVETKSLLGGFSAAGDVVCFLQLIAFLEIIHSALGLVRSGTLYAFMQWLGRSHVLFAIIAKLPEVQEQPPVMITFLAWSMSEVIRYPQYALGLLGLCPRWLTWLRYTAFIVLYPIGALYGEMLAMYLSLGPIKKQDLYANSFKWLPFDYHAFVVGLMLAYPFLWLMLYLHMFQQRKSKLSKKGSSGNRRKPVKTKGVD